MIDSKTNLHDDNRTSNRGLRRVDEPDAVVEWLTLDNGVFAFHVQDVSSLYQSTPPGPTTIVEAGILLLTPLDLEAYSRKLHWMKARYTTEAEILKAIERAQANVLKWLTVSEFQEKEAQRFWKEAHELELKGGTVAEVEILRRNGRTHKELSGQAERCANRILKTILPRLGEKLSVFRTDTLRMQEKEVRTWDHSIPV